MTKIEGIYKTICDLLTDFENSTDNPDDDDYLSDGQWLDEFYTLMVKVKNEIETFLEEIDDDI